MSGSRASVVVMALCTSSILSTGCTVAGSHDLAPVFAELPQQIRFEERVEFSPSGPTTIRSWRDSTTRKLLKVEFLDARSGEAVLAGTRLIRNKNGQWRIDFADGATCLLYRPEDTLPHATKCADKRGSIWAVLVQGLSSPRIIPGTVTEDEFKLTVSFTASEASPPK